MQASMYLQFFSYSAATRIFSSVLVTYDSMSVLMTRISKMQFMPIDQKYQIRRPPFCS